MFVLLPPRLLHKEEGVAAARRVVDPLIGRGAEVAGSFGETSASCLCTGLAIAMLVKIFAQRWSFA